MKKLIRWICKIIGIKTCYLVTGNYTVEGSNSVSFVEFSCPLAIYPWLHLDNYDELLRHTKKELKQDRVNITSIKKTGALK